MGEAVKGRDRSKSVMLHCGGGPVARGRERAPLARQTFGFFLSLGELGGETLGAASQLELALAQLSRAPHQVDPLGGQPRLLESQRFGMVAFE